MNDNKCQDLHFNDDQIDDHVDEEIRQCFSEINPKCFFMFAGAGSGKTKSLVNALSFLDNKVGNTLASKAKKIAIITYTNSACDEISRRLQYNPLFSVSTIHSFLWELIKHYQSDIKTWVIQHIKDEISLIKDELLKGRSDKAANKRREKITRYNERLTNTAW